MAWSRYLTEDQEDFLDELLGDLELDEDDLDPPAPDERCAVTIHVSYETKAALNRLGREAGLRGAGPFARLLVLSYLRHGDFPRSRRRRIARLLR